jgi:hypothetical protein
MDQTSPALLNQRDRISRRYDIRETFLAFAVAWLRHLRSCDVCCTTAASDLVEPDPDQFDVGLCPRGARFHSDVLRSEASWAATGGRTVLSLLPDDGWREVAWQRGHMPVELPSHFLSQLRRPSPEDRARFMDRRPARTPLP